MQAASIKKAKEEQVKKMTKGLMANHDKVHGSISMSDVANTFAGTDSLDGIEIGLGDVSMLAPEEDDEQGPVKEEPVDEDAAEDEEEEDSGKRPAKRAKWFDRDRAVMKASRQLQGALSKVQTSATQVKDTLSKLLTDVGNMSQSIQENLAGERVIAEARLQLLQKLYGTSEELAKHIRTIKAQASQASNLSQGTSQDPTKCLGLAAPCQTFESLKTFSDCKAAIEKVMEATDAETIEKMRRDCNEMRGPISDLVSACKSAAGDISKGVKAMEASKKAAAKSSARKHVGGPASASTDIFQLTGSCVKVKTVKEGTFSQADCDLPCVIEADHQKQTEFERLDAVKRYMIGDFLAVFNAQSSAQKCDRAHRRLAVSSEVRDAVTARLQALCSFAAPTADKFTTLAEAASTNIVQAFEPMPVIVAKNTLTCSPEKSYAGLG